jgi:hypothetical protein
VAGTLAPGSTWVGIWIELEHLAASPIGAEVVAGATLTACRWPPVLGRGPCGPRNARIAAHDDADG